MIKPKAAIKRTGRAAGEVLDTARLKAFVDRVRAEQPQVYVGVPRGAPEEQNGTPMAVVAAAHEFGAPKRGIPERSYLRLTLNTNRPKYVNFNRAVIPRIVRGQIGFEQALGMLGEMAKGDVQRFMASNSYQLKPATIKRKGSSRALIDTGNLRQSITWVLNPDEEKKA
jgi:hypothetical protein